MKRCIVCGNIGSDDSTICSECGNLYVEMDDGPESGTQEDSVEKMEEQLKEMWAKVREEEVSSSRKQAAEPELTVISEDTAAQEEETEAESHKPVEVETLMKAAAEKTAEEKTAEGDDHAGEPAQTAAAGASAPSENPAKPDLREDKSPEPEPQKADEAKGQISGEENPQEAEQSTQQSAQRAARSRTRRTKSGPQIYGQDSMAQYSGAQGVIRRDVQGGHVTDKEQIGGESGRSASRPPRRPASVPAESDITVQDTSAEVPSDIPAAAQDVPANAQSMQGNGSRPAPQVQRMNVPPYQQSPQGYSGSGHQGSKHSGTAHRIMLAAQDALSSPLLLVIALLQTVYFVSAAAAVFMRQLNYEQFAKLLTLLPFPSQISGYVTMFQAAMAQLDSGAPVLNLVIRVPDLLLCVSLWTLWITARNADEKMPGTGFLFMKITAILNMVASCLVLLLVLVVCVIFVIAAWNAGTTSLITIAVVTLAVAIILTLAVIMYFFCWLATIKTIQKNAVNGERYGNASVYVAAVKMVIALTAIVSILSGIVNLEITGILTGIGQLGWMILFGVWILKYRSTLREYNK
ncbi:MAG: hypothetical protein LIO76_07325 [Clostridiales bacterium]|nr:hypothetical protein [Clostridiales bacterium]